MNFFTGEGSILFLELESWKSKGYEKCYLYWFLSIFRHFFLKSYKFDFLQQGPDRNLLLVVDDLIEQPIVLILHHNPLIRKFKKNVWYWFVSNFKLIFFNNYRYDSSNQSTRQKLSFHGLEFNWHF